MTLRMTLDDGVHRMPLRTWAAPIVDAEPAYVGLGGTETAIPNDRVQAWGAGIAWAGEVKDQWAGDWVRAGDFNGDGKTDIAVFTGGDHPRVGVALSTGTGFQPTVRWHDFFALNGEYPLVGRFNADRMDDIVTFTPDGNAYVALSTGHSFEGTGQLWGTGLATKGDLPAIGDVDGDGLDDAVLFARYGGTYGIRGRDRGSVWVARNTGTGFEAPRLALNGFCEGEKIPLVGDLNRDGRADLVCVDEDTGNVWVSLNSPSGFTPPALWMTGTGPRWSRPTVTFAYPTSTSLLVSAFGPRPDLSLLSGPLPFLSFKHGAPALVWFNRSALGAGDAQGNVLEAPAVAGPEHPVFSGPARVRSFFSVGAEWPVVGDFNGDSISDIATLVPSRPAVEGWYLDRPGIAGYLTPVAYPGDLYVSAKPGTMGPLTSLPPRVHRVEIDLSSFAGRSISLEIQANNGPTPDGDMVIWPDLKVYRLTGPSITPVSTAVDSAIRAYATMTRGDVNGDGRVDVIDAILTLRIAVGLDALAPLAARVGDFNGNGRLDVSDAVTILQAAVGLVKPESLPLPRPIPVQPIVVTGPSDSVGPTSAHLTGTVWVDAPVAGGVQWHFHVVPSAGAAFDTEPATAAADEPVRLQPSATLVELAPGTEYTAQLVVDSLKVAGEPVKFTTPKAAPGPLLPTIAQTLPPDAVSRTGATLEGLVRLSKGTAARAYFDVDAVEDSLAAHAFRTPEIKLVSTGDPTPVVFTVPGGQAKDLEPGQQYSVTLHVLLEDGSEAVGSPERFSTATGPVDAAITLPPGPVTADTAELHGMLTTSVPAAYGFKVTDLKGGLVAQTALLKTAGPVEMLPVKDKVGGLRPDTDYLVTLTADASGIALAGPPIPIHTAPSPVIPPPPGGSGKTVTALPAEKVGFFDAVLVGKVTGATPGTAKTIVYFELMTSDGKLILSTDAQAVLKPDQTFTASVQKLVPDTTYLYDVVCESAAGTLHSDVMKLHTQAAPP